jgi:hypothetical protein
MTQFAVYLKLGLNHITDLNAYDHMVFITALCAVYLLKDWRKILILVTAFTVGHSVSLALAVLKLVTIPSYIIEFLIPVTILVTSLSNILLQPTEKNNMKFKYLLTLCFGLIHGMGFSNYLSELLGANVNLFQPLLAFNLGIELGQLGIVAVALGVGYAVMQVFKAPERAWNIFLSGMTFGISLILLKEVWPF